MLVLSRRRHETVVVGGGPDPMLKVTVLEISGSRVRLGFDCDREIPVRRLEIWQPLIEGDAPISDVSHRAPTEAEPV